jgi:adenosine kinase
MAKASRLSFRDFAYDSIDLVIISPNDPRAMVKYAKECQELEIPYIYDPSQQIPRLSAQELIEGIRGAMVLIVNEYEYGMIRNRTGLSQDEIEASVDVSVITLGERGSLIRTPGKEYEIPSVAPKRLVDPTGVGDAYRAGLIAGMCHNLSWDVAGRIGSLAATYVLEEHGTQRHHYALANFFRRYAENFGDSQQIEVLSDPHIL